MANVQHVDLQSANNQGTDLNAIAESEFRYYDRVRSSEAHVLFDIGEQILPIGYFEKFSCKSKSEIIYRQPVGAKVPIGEHKPGGWDLSMSMGMISDELWAVQDTYTKIKFDGGNSPRITILQRIKFNAKTIGNLGGASVASTTQSANPHLYLLTECVMAGFEMNDPGNGDPLETSASGYARFRMFAPSGTTGATVGAIVANP